MKINMLLSVLLLSLSLGLSAMEADWETPLQKIKSDKLDEALFSVVEKNEPAFILAYLKNQGANINAQDAFGDTPLHIAARNGNNILVNWLLLNDAILTLNEKQYSPYHVATPEIKDLLKKFAVNRKVLACAQLGDMRGMEQAFLRGAKTYMRDAQGLTPFHIAAAYGHISMVEWLYQIYPEYIDAKDNEGRDALYWAIRNGHFEMVEWFVDSFPALIEKRDRRYERAVYWAAANGHIEVVDLLTDSYPHLAKSIDENQEWIKYYAKKRGHSQVTKWLIERIVSLSESAA